MDDRPPPIRKKLSDEYIEKYIERRRKKMFKKLVGDSPIEKNPVISVIIITTIILFFLWWNF